MPLTEDQIERMVERKIDALDHEYLTTSSHLSAFDYDRRIREIDEWAGSQLAQKASTSTDCRDYDWRNS